MSYKITVDQIDITQDGVRKTSTMYIQEVESININAIFAAVNPKPKRTRRTKAESAATK